MGKSHFKKAIASLEARIAEHQLILELQEECQNVLSLVSQLQLSELSDLKKSEVIEKSISHSTVDMNAIPPYSKLFTETIKE